MAKQQKKDTDSLDVWLNNSSPTRKVENMHNSFNEKKKSSYKKIDYERKLNPEQQEVVFNLGVNMLVKIHCLMKFKSINSLKSNRNISHSIIK